jgi:1-acyl-sn-glycerol-3-phosphate acyltransferase
MLVWTPLMFAIHLADRDPARYRTGRWFRRLGAVMTRANPSWRVHISGILPTNPRHPYVVVGNHQSNADIPVISRLPWDMKWVAKKELFAVPVLGWMMRISRDIPVDRKDRGSRADVLTQAGQRLAARASVMFFPEGTRSRDGRIGRFSEGAFRLAIRTGTPILPLAVDGTSGALPKKSWRFGTARGIRVHVFDPVPVAHLSEDDVRSLLEQVRARIVQQVASWRGATPGEVDALE